MTVGLADVVGAGGGAVPRAIVGPGVLGADPAGAFDPRGPVAEEIADLWWFMLALGVMVFAIFAVALVVSLTRRPGGAQEDAARPTPRSASRWIVFGGVALPVVVVTAVLAVTVDTMRVLPDGGEPEALVVEVVGHRWWWSFEYPELGVTTANELHLPVGRPVELRLLSADVIHSFWVPPLAGKLDLLPDEVNTLVLAAEQPGEMLGVCAEFCGLQHAKMLLVTVVEPEEDFEAWAAAQRLPAAEPTTEAAVRGQRLFSEAGCADCHTIAGTEAAGTGGPDLTHLASRNTIGSGSVELDHESLVQWVTDPHALKEGVLMPPAELDAEQIDAVVAYLESLE